MISMIARFKIYVDRARWYIVLVQFFMILLIYIDTKSIELVWWHYPIIVSITILAFILMGFIDKRIGLIKEEQRFYSTQNPVLQEILKEVRKEK